VATALEIFSQWGRWLIDWLGDTVANGEGNRPALYSSSVTCALKPTNPGSDANCSATEIARASFSDKSCAATHDLTWRDS
jgi:hypothetical protein